MKKLFLALEKWGHYPLAALCAAVILLSALWTKDGPVSPPPDAQAISDQSQRLGQEAAEPAKPPLLRPAEGPVLRPWDDAPVFLPETGLWQVLPGMDFAAFPREDVRAMAAGVVLSCVDGVALDHGGGLVSQYLCAAVRSLRAGQAVQAGEVIGHADDTGRVRVILTRNGESQAFGKDWVDNPPNLSYNKLK